MRVVIIGGSYGGIMTALALRKLSDSVEIIVLEKKSEIGFVPSTLNWQLKHPSEDRHTYHWICKDDLEKKNIAVLLGMEVLTIKSHHVITQKEALFYDRLIIATGSGQKSRLITSSNQSIVMTFKTMGEIDKVMSKVKSITKVAIIGAGLVGLELAESLIKMGVNVHVFDHNRSILSRHFDEDLAIPVQDSLADLGVIFHLGHYVKSVDVSKESPDTANVSVENSHNESDDHQENFELVLIAVNTRPDNTRWQECLKLNDDQTIWVDRFLKTSSRDVFAIGDAISVNFTPLNVSYYISLVNNAIRTAKIAAINCLSSEEEMIRDSGSVRDISNELAGRYIASVGLTQAEKIFCKNEVELETIYFTKRTNSKKQATARIFYDSEKRIVLGAQLVSQDPIDYELAVMRAAVKNQQTIESLFFETAPYNSGRDYPIGLFDKMAIKSDVLKKKSLQTGTPHFRKKVKKIGPDDYDN